MAVEVVRNLPVGHGDGSWIMRATGQARPYICTMSFNFTSAPTSVQLLDIQDAWGDTVMTMVQSGVVLENFHVFYKLDSSNDQVFDANGPPIAGSGGLAGTSHPPNVAYLARKQTAYAGRRNVGRLYIPGVPEAGADGLGNVDAALITTWNTKLGTLFSRLTQYNPEIVHSKQWDPTEEPNPPTPALPTPITGLVLDNVIATQRRRLHR